MKKLLLLFAVLFILSSSFAAFIDNPSKNASEVFLPIGKTGQKISLMQLSTISIKDFEALSGRHMNFFERLSFNGGQKKLRKSIAEDGTVKNQKLLKSLESGDHSTGFHLGGFALGFLFGLLGVLLAYVIGGEEENKRNRTKWAWIGLGVLVVVAIIVAATIKLN